jgi:hypothetical protein
MLKFLIRPASTPDVKPPPRDPQPDDARKKSSADEATTPGQHDDDFEARLKRMREQKKARKSSELKEEAHVDDSVEPRSKRLKEKRKQRLSEQKFGRDMDWADGEDNKELSDDDRIVDDEVEEEEEEEESAAEDGLPSDEEEAVESGEEDGEEEEEEEEEEAEAAEGSESESEAEEEAAPPSLEKVVGERLVDGALQYKVQWRPSMEKTWMAADAEALSSLAGKVALDKYAERKARRAARAQADLEEAIAAGWAVPVERERSGEVRDGEEEGGEEEQELPAPPAEDDAARANSTACEDEQEGGRVEEEGAAEDEDDEADAALWVCCDDCGKWRRLPVGTEAPSEEAAWACQMNPDPERNTCEAEAEEMPEGGEEEEEEEEREVDSLRARRETADGTEEFRVRWKGCTWEEDTWRPRESLGDEHIERFLRMEAAQKRVAELEAQSRQGKKQKAKKGSSFVRF